MKAERFRQAQPKTGRQAVAISRWKHFFTVLLSLVAVASAALLPPVLSRARDQFSLPGVHLESAVPVTMETDASLSLREKLALICRTRREETRAITSIRELSLTEAAEVWESAKPELELMMKYGAFSAEFDPLRLIASHLSLAVCTDTEDLSRSVSVWDLALSDPEGVSDHLMHLNLEVESGKILEYSFMLPYHSSVAIDEEEQSLSLRMENTAEGLSDYLGIDWSLYTASPGEPSEFFSSDKKIRYVMYGDGIAQTQIVLS